MGKINVLSEDVSQLIAAGEVVDRPASIIKELLENSIDANAKNIVVEIKNGGSTFIKVEDDGDGFLYDDIKIAFTRHATSKIKNKDDLDNIFTLGFRGEAMPSISSVSKMSVITKTENSDIGKILTIHGGKEISFEDIGCKNGTTIVVTDLFYNTPARLKFLKKDVTESNVVASVIDKIALSYPQISFTFIKDNKVVLKTPGDNILRNTIACVFNNKNIQNEYIEVKGNENNIDIYGYVSSPSNTRSNRTMQYFYVNGRFIKSQICSVAFERAYKNIIMTGKYPSCVLNIKMSPKLFDINVHPSKIEVRFSDEKKVFDIIYSTVKAALLIKSRTVEKQFSIEPMVKNHIEYEKVKQQNAFNSIEKNDNIHTVEDKNNYNELHSDVYINTPVFKEKKTFKDINIYFDDDYNNKAEYSMLRSEVSIDLHTSNENDKVKDIDNNNIHIDINECVNNQLTYLDAVYTPDISIIGEVFNTYIIFKENNKVYFLDKHAGHERLIYEKVKGGIFNTTESQKLLEPITVDLEKVEYDCVISNIDILKKSGFVVDDFFNGTVIINEIPTYLIGQDIKDIFIEISNNLYKNMGTVEFNSLDWLCESIACRSAIKANDKNMDIERKKLVEDIYKYDLSKYCPHGRPIMVEIKKENIERIFGR